MSVVVLNDLATVKLYLNKTNVKYRYICCTNENYDAANILKEGLHEEIKISNYPEEFREEFFKTYIDLVGKLGAELNSIYWWASFTASKNRFMSDLLPHLSIYYIITQAIQENKQKDILLIDPPYPVIKALKQYCRENSIKIKIAGSSAYDYCVRVADQLMNFPKVVSFVLRNWVKIFIVRLRFKGKFKKNCKDGEYYVIRTWIYPSSIGSDNKYSDSFFGRLPGFLISNKKKLLIIAGIINDYKNTVNRLSNCQEYAIFPQEYFLKYSDVVKSCFDCYRGRIKLKKRVDFYGLDVSHIVQGEIDKDYRQTIRTEILQRYVINNALKDFKIETFITTYENNPWEKVCFLALREYSPSTKIIGYQHAVVSKASANMVCSKDEISIIPMPDKIITVGEITKRIMEKDGHYPEEKIYPSCALRHEYIYKANIKGFSRNKNILVVLEGVYNCYKLANFVFTALSDIEDYYVVIRTHPERPFEKIKNDLNFDINLNNNFSISTSNLKDDLLLADIVIYWGSTVGLEALMMGIPVIHVDLNDMISVDPLYECDHLKWTVKNIAKFPKVLNEIDRMSDGDYTDQYKKAKAYIERYLQRVTDSRLQEFIN